MCTVHVRRPTTLTLKEKADKHADGVHQRCLLVDDSTGVDIMHMFGGPAKWLHASQSQPASRPPSSAPNPRRSLKVSSTLVVIYPTLFFWSALESRSYSPKISRRHQSKSSNSRAVLKKMVSIIITHTTTHYVDILVDLPLGVYHAPPPYRYD